MKKFMVLAVLGLLFVNASMVMAETSVQPPATFTLELNQKISVLNVFNSLKKMQIGLNKIKSISTLSYPAQIKKNVEIIVTAIEACGSNNITNQVPPAAPCYLDTPSFSNTYTINEGNSVKALVLNIKVISISDSSATFAISITGNSDPKPGSGGSNVGPSNESVVSNSGVIKICPNGMTGNNCSVCANGECVPDVAVNNQSSSTGPVFNLDKGQTLLSSERIEANGDVPVHFEVTTKERAWLFFIFPMSRKITYSVNAETGANTVISRPWWSFLAW